MRSATARESTRHTARSVVAPGNGIKRSTTIRTHHPPRQTGRITAGQAPIPRAAGERRQQTGAESRRRARTTEQTPRPERTPNALPTRPPTLPTPKALRRIPGPRRRLTLHQLRPLLMRGRRRLGRGLRRRRLHRLRRLGLGLGLRHRRRGSRLPLRRLGLLRPLPVPLVRAPFDGVAFPDGSAAPEADGAAEADLDAEGPGEAEPRRFPCPDWYPVPPPPVTAEPPSGFSPPRCPADGDGPGFRPSSPTLIQPAAAATAMTVAARRTDTFKARTAATSEGGKRGSPPAQLPPPARRHAPPDPPERAALHSPRPERPPRSGAGNRAPGPRTPACARRRAHLFLSRRGHPDRSGTTPGCSPSEWHPSGPARPLCPHGGQTGPSCPSDYAPRR